MEKIWKSCEFRACCCISQRIGVVIISISSIILGIAGLIPASYFIYEDVKESQAIEENERIRNSQSTTESSLFAEEDFQWDTLDELGDLENFLRFYVYSIFYSTIVLSSNGIVLLFGAYFQNLIVTCIGLGSSFILFLGSIIIPSYILIKGRSQLFTLIYFLIIPLQFYFLWVILDYCKHLFRNRNSIAEKCSIEVVEAVDKGEFVMNI